MSPSLFSWTIRDGQLTLGQRPLLMGIVNVTPDSFSDGQRYLHVNDAVEQAQRLVDSGADLIDIGGESTRPGAEPVSVEEELRRVVPVIEQLQGRIAVPISIDTTKAVVAHAALSAGAAIVNDISALRFDPEMVGVCVEFRAGVVAMHMQGTPQTMQNDPRYDDVVREVAQFFRQRQTELFAQGLLPSQLVWDPGVGFGKTAAHNVALLSDVAALRAAGQPILIGHSRKRFLKHVIGREVDERLAGTIGVTLAVAAQGAYIIRVHDVQANRDALAAFLALRSVTPST